MKNRRLVDGSLRSQRGQGTLEYIMVLTVTVILILTVVYQFNDAFRKYAEQFFDGYLACLLETGELPGRGGDCTSDYRRFSVADGKPAITGGLGDGTGGDGTGGNGGGDGTGSGGGGGGSGGKDGNGGNDANAKAGNGGNDGGGSGGGSESSPAGGGNVAAVGSIGNRGKGRARSTAVSQAKNGDQGGEGGKESLIAPLPGMNRASNSSESGRSKKTALDRGFGYWGQEEVEEQAQAKPPVATVTTKNEAGDNLKAKKVSVENSRKTASVQQQDEGGFSFGYLLRIILITGIILAIVVFMGGQLMQIAKSSEK